MVWLLFLLLSAVALAAPVIHDFDQETPVSPDKPSWSAKIVQKFESAEQAQEFARTNGLQYVGPAHLGSPFHVFEPGAGLAGRAPEGVPAPEKIVQRHPRVPGGHRASHARDVGVFGMRNSPSGIDRQWSLQTETVFGVNHANLEAVPAWKRGWRGTGAKVLIVDNGVQREHEDLAGAVLPLCSRSVVPGDERPSDPSPEVMPNGRVEATHGTMCAGIIAGRNDTNQRCGMGVAPDAGLCAIKLYGEGGYVTDSMESGALFCGDCTVVSVSFGPNDYSGEFGGPGQATQHTLYQMSREARGGRGVPIVWAGGNGGDRLYRDTSNADAYANSVYVIAVGAIADDRVVARYSEPGENIMLVGPSSGGWNGILTAFPSASHVECTSTMGGTSAVAPAIAGLSAVVLAQVPGLTSRQLEHVLVLSTQQRMKDEALYAQTHATGGYFLGDRGSEFPWKVNGAGLAHSGLLGFGVPSVVRAVEMAMRTDMYWHNLPEQRWTMKRYTLGDGKVSASSTQVFTEHIAGSGTLRYVERVQLQVSLDAPSTLAPLRIEVESPAGTVSRVWPETRHTQTSMRWVLSSVAFWNERAEGPWKVRFINGGAQRAMVHALALTVHGYGDVVTGRSDNLVFERIFTPGTTTTDMRELV